MRIQQNEKDLSAMSKKEMAREIMARGNALGQMVEQFADQMAALVEVKTDQKPTDEMREKMEAIIYEKVMVDSMNESFIIPATKDLSESTLRDVLRFMRTDAGRQYTDFTKRAVPEFTELMQENADKAFDAIMEELS